ncbi:MAG: MerR family transcriptional regulator [Chloroflexota bacterium]|nr:MerR family transcriptional regulator [Chloroflexota bacterium]
MSPSATHRRMTIGAVLAALTPDFPDVTISKIRFLEAEGLLTPERTGSGYRTFSADDLERLRYILTAQRDRFWPLKVIGEALDKLDRGLEPAPGDAAPSRPQVPVGAADRHLPSASELRRRDHLRLTGAELCDAATLDKPMFEALTTFGLLRADASGHYGDAALAVARAAGALAAYGIEPRHLRPFRTAADREIGLVQQVLSPIRGRSKGTGAKPTHDPTPQILAECIALHTALVRAGLAAE